MKQDVIEGKLFRKTKTEFSNPSIETKFTDDKSNGGFFLFLPQCFLLL